MRKPGHPSPGAFSLPEILVATGLFAIAALAITGLFSLSMNQERAAREEARATGIATGILENLRAGTNARHVVVAVGMNGGVPLWKSIDPETTPSVCVCYDASGNPLEELDPGTAALPVGNRDASSVATVTFRHKTPIPELVTVEIGVGAPAAAPEEHRSIRTFVRRIAEETP